MRRLYRWSTALLAGAMALCLSAAPVCAAVSAPLPMTAAAQTASLSKLGYAAFTSSRRQLNTFEYFSLDSNSFSVTLPSEAAMVSIEAQSGANMSLSDGSKTYSPSGGYFHAIPVSDSTTLTLTVKNVGVYTIQFKRQAAPSNDSSISSAYYEFYDASGSRLVGKQFNGFSSGTTTYTFSMPKGSSYFTFQPNVAQGAQVSYTAGGKGVPYSYIPASAGSVTATVTAPSGDKTTYTFQFQEEEEKEPESSSEDSSSEEPSSQESSSELSSSSESSSEISSQSSSASSQDSESSKSQEDVKLTSSRVTAVVSFFLVLAGIILVLVLILRLGLHKEHD